MPTPAEVVYEVFNIPTDDWNPEYVVRRHEKAINFLYSDERIANLVSYWLLSTLKEGRIPVALVPPQVIKDLLELGFVFGYLSKEEELRRL